MELRVSSHGLENFCKALDLIDMPIVGYLDTGTELLLFSGKNKRIVQIIQRNLKDMSKPLFEWLVLQKRYENLRLMLRNQTVVETSLDDLGWYIETHNPQKEVVQGHRVGTGCSLVMYYRRSFQ